METLGIFLIGMALGSFGTWLLIGRIQAPVTAMHQKTDRGHLQTPEP